MATTKGFIKDWLGNHILPITRGELVLDQEGNVALTSKFFLAGENGAQYGLVTAAEREMLKGTGTGGGISDLYTKLNYINSGLSFGNVGLNFYDANGTATPIKVISTGDGAISITVSGQTVNLSLAELTTDAVTATDIIKGLKVDKYGRVTEVTSGKLTNADIPAELSGKTLKESTLDGCKTANKDIANDELAVANRAYVDSKFNSAIATASGALKFYGPISSSDSIEVILTDQQFWHNYFKVTSDNVEIALTDLVETSGISGSKLKCKTGDTLIVRPPESGTRSKFVYVPSGDDITSITVKGDSELSAAVNGAVGPVTFRFSSVFGVTNTGGQTAYITLPAVSTTTHGYLTKEDYAAFKNYANALSIAYTGDLTAGAAGVYKIGTLTFGSGTSATTKDILGKNNISALSLIDGAANAYNPILKFTETGATDVNITITGLNGVVTKKNGNAIEIGAANEIVEQDVPQPSNPRKVKYLTIESGYKFGVQIGSADANGNVVQDGLTDFSQFNALVNKVSHAVSFEEISYSLNGSVNAAEYRYGNDKLKTAVTLTI